jgi:hypothetical protein
MMNVFTPSRPPRCQSSGKKRYRDRKDAKRVVINARRIKLSADGQGLTTRRLENRTYRCHDCGGWHVTSKPPKIP